MRKDHYPYSGKLVRRLTFFLPVLVIGTVLAINLRAADEMAVRPEINPGLGESPSGINRKTPQASWSSFWGTCQTGRYDQAAHLMDLTEVELDQQRGTGTDLAEKLIQILQQTSAVPHQFTPGNLAPSPTTNNLVAHVFEKSGIKGQMWLRRTRDTKTGEIAWLFTRKTVSSIPYWYRILVKGEKADPPREVNAGLGATPGTVHRANPRETVRGFLEAARRGDFRKASYFLDLNHIIPAQQAERGTRLSRRLYLVALRTRWPSPDLLSNDEFGSPRKGDTDTGERVANVDMGNQQTVPITLTRYLDPVCGTTWVFSQQTVRRIDTLYQSRGYGWVGDCLPTVFFTVELLGLQLWQWSMLLIILLIGYVIARLCNWILLGILGIIVRRTVITWDDEIVTALDGPMAWMLWGILVAMASPLVGLSESAAVITSRGWKMLILIGVGQLLFRMVDGIVTIMRKTAGSQSPVGVAFMPILSRVFKVIVILLIGLAMLDVVGVQVLGLLTGLGIGGLAVAFAAQKTLENLFGAVSIAGDRPFHVGDWVTIGSVTGAVEDVGLRSIRLRTMERTRVTIPNGVVTGGQIINLGARDRLMYNPVFELSARTSSAQIMLIVDELTKFLSEDSRIYQESKRVRFKGFGAGVFQIELLCWVMTSDYHLFTGVVEDINLAILSIVESAGTSLSLPERTVITTSGSVSVSDGAEKAEAELATRFQEGRLHLTHLRRYASPPPETSAPEGD